MGDIVDDALSSRGVSAKNAIEINETIIELEDLADYVFDREPGFLTGPIYLLKDHGKPVSEHLGKIALIKHYMGDMTKADLARYLKVDPKAVRRILDPKHRSKGTTTDKVLAALGISWCVAYDTEPFQFHTAWHERLPYKNYFPEFLKHANKA